MKRWILSLVAAVALAAACVSPAHAAGAGVRSDGYPDYTDIADDDELIYWRRSAPSQSGAGNLGNMTGVAFKGWLDGRYSIQSHIEATGNIHGLTASQLIAILRGRYPEWCPSPLKQPTQPTLDADLTARLAADGCEPGDVIWIEGPEPGGAPGDTTAPTVTAFDLPAASTSLTVPISSFAATDNTGVTGYLVTESSSPPAAGAAGWTGSAPANYVSTAVGSRTAYAWAKDAAGNVSAGVSDTVVITTSPNAPTGLSGTAGDTTLTANWTVSAADSTHSAATSQRVYGDTDSNPFDSANYQDFANNTTATHQFSGLTNGQAYYIGVRATNSAGSTNSTVAGPYTPSAGGDAQAPTVSTFTVGSATALTVPVTAYTATDNVGVTGYLVTESSTPPSAASVNLASAPTSYTTGAAGIKSLYPWARDATGNVSAAFGSPRSVTFLAAPAGVSATPGDAQVIVSWSAVTNATSYDLTWGTASGDLGNTITGVTSPYTHTGLTNGTTYYYGVLAKATGSTSAQSSEVSGTPVAIPVPANLTIYVGGATQLDLSWDAVADATSYTLQSADSGSGPWSDVGTQPQTGRTASVTGLTTGAAKFFHVRANTAGGSSAYSPAVSGTPVALTTNTVNSTASLDGYVEYGGADFATTRAASIGTLSDAVATTARLINGANPDAYPPGGVYKISRLFLAFDLSGVSGTVGTVKLNLNVTDNRYNPFVSAYEWLYSPADGLGWDDYSKFGGTSFGTVQKVGTGSFQLSLNAAGKAFFQSKLGGMAYMCLRLYDHDVANSELVGDYKYLTINTGDSATGKPNIEVGVW